MIQSWPAMTWGWSASKDRCTGGELGTGTEELLLGLLLNAVQEQLRTQPGDAGLERGTFVCPGFCCAARAFCPLPVAQIPLAGLLDRANSIRRVMPAHAPRAAQA